MIPQNHVESPRGRLGQAPGRHRRRRGTARSSAPPCPRPDLRLPKLAHAASRRPTRLVTRPAPAVASERGPQGAQDRRGRGGPLSGYSPKTAKSCSMTIADGRRNQAPAPAASAAPSCTATRTTLQLSRLGRPPYGRFGPVHVWPVLRCPPRFLARVVGAVTGMTNPRTPAGASSDAPGSRRAPFARFVAIMIATA